jgi:uncharacterized membrane protein YciS (DUF1049 family)
MNSEKYKWFYPGTMTSKRVKHIMTCSLFGITLFFGILQQDIIKDLYKIADSGFERSIKFSEHVQGFFTDGYFVKHIITGLDYLDLKSASAEVTGNLKFAKSSAAKSYHILNLTMAITGLMMIGVLRSVAWIILDIRHGEYGKHMNSLFRLSLYFNAISFLLTTA